MRTSIILAASSLMLFPLVADAADMQGDQAELMQSSSATMAQSEAEERLETEIEVDESSPTIILNPNVFPVQDENGNIFYNQIIPASDLTPVDFDVEIVDSYEFSHEGRIYRNNIIEK
jgi:hypothetical protein